MNPKQQISYGIIAGTAFILLYVCLSFAFQYHSDTQKDALHLLISLGAAGFASSIGGIINITDGRITAGGAMAVFVIVFLWNPDPLQNNKLSTQTIDGKVYLDSLPFHFASVSLEETNDQPVYTNESGHFTIKTSDLRQAPGDSLEFRIKGDAMLIEELVKIRSGTDPIKIWLARKPLSSEPREDNPLVKSVESELPKEKETPPQPVKSEKVYCVECLAITAQNKVVNRKSACRDSLYLVNYILGFTKASDEQMRRAICTWKIEESALYNESLYNVQLKTGGHADAATKELVNIRFIGKNGHSFSKPINSAGRNDREKNQTDSYDISYQRDIGEITSVILTIQDREQDKALDDWQIESIVVTDQMRDKSYTKRSINKWIGDGGHAKSIEIEIPFDE